MDSFKRLLNSDPDAIKQARVTNVIRTTCDESKRKIGDKLHLLRELENHIEQTLDIRPDSSVDLNSSLKTFAPKKFIDDLYDDVTKLKELYDRIQLGMNLHNALFPEDQIEALNDYDKEFISNIISQ